MSNRQQAVLSCAAMAASLVGGCITQPGGGVQADLHFDNQALALTVTYQTLGRTRTVDLIGASTQIVQEKVSRNQMFTFQVTYGNVTTSVECSVGADMIPDQSDPINTGFGVVTIAQTSTGVEAACTDNWEQSGLGLAITAGNGQSGPVGGLLSLAVTIPLSPPSSAPVQLSWHVTSGGGSLGSATTRPPRPGGYTNEWTLGSAGPQEVTVVSAGGERVIFTATLLSAGLEMVSGDGQSAPADGLLPQPLVVKYVDQFGNPGPSRLLSWQVGGGGALTTLSTTSSASTGLSQNSWTLGAAGAQSVTVSEVGGSSVTFTATIQGPGVACSGGTTHAPPTGQILADETWTLAQSPHQVPSDLFFINASLTLEPGAVVCGGQVATLTFQNDGRLIADGTAAAPITFTAADPLLGWEGLSLQNLSAGASSLRNVHIEYADRGMLVLGHPVVMDSIIVRQSLGAALDLRGSGIEVLHSRVDTTHTPGIAAVSINAPDTRFESTVRGAAGIGIEVTAGVGAILMNCEVFGSGSHGMSLVFATVSNCNLAGNGGDGIAGVTALLVTAQGNWWGDVAGPNGPAGDGVSGVVDFSNFLTAPAAVGPRP